MKALYAPWRMDFIFGKKEKGCVFCNRVKRSSDKKDFILHRGRWSFVILNKFPYNNGHLMVVPNRHVASLGDLKKQEREEIFEFLQKSERVIQKALKAQGFNIGLNLGKAAGAGIDDHIHFHLVPRWFADTNFWPVISETKSMPEHLTKTYDRLKRLWK